MSFDGRSYPERRAYISFYTTGQLRVKGLFNGRPAHNLPLNSLDHWAITAVHLPLSLLHQKCNQIVFHYIVHPLYWAIMLDWIECFLPDSFCVLFFLNAKNVTSKIRKEVSPSGRIFPLVAWQLGPWKVLHSPLGIFHIHILPSAVPASNTGAQGCHCSH